MGSDEDAPLRNTFDIHRKKQDVEVQDKIDQKHKDISMRGVVGYDFIS